MPKFTRERGEQIREDIQRRERQYRSHSVDEAIQVGYEKLYDGDYAALGRLMRDILIPRMNVSRHTLRSTASEVLDENAGLIWNHTALKSFAERPDRYIQSVTPGAEPPDDRDLAGQMYVKAAGMEDPKQRRRKTISEAFHSLESLAVVRNHVSNSVTNWAPAFGYELQLGTWYQPPRGDMPHKIQLVDPGDSEEVTVNMGKPGRGKGVMGHTEAEDRYAAGRKVVDLVDFDECEGGCYDIPMANPVLREAREEMGLPPDFTELDGYDPQLEIMVPMSQGLKDKHIPYHGDGPTDTVIKPFTVPAADLSKKALKRFIAGELTKTNKNIFETAYDQIQRSRDDWNLHDLMQSVERQRGLHGNQGAVDRVQRAIQRIQQKGWIRDRDDPNAIDWTRIWTSPEVITVFTAGLMPDTDEAEKYLFHSYVIYAARKELKALKALPTEEKRKRGFTHVPKAQAILRELHNIAPNSETSSDDPTIREIQEAMTSDFRDLTAMHRHEGMEVTADTQNFIGEIKKRARVNFNRACLFSVDFSPAKAMFEEVAGEPRDQYPRTVTRNFGVGECAVLGRVGTGRSFEMTIAVAPPMSHHFDPDEWVHPKKGITRDSEDLEDQFGKDSNKWFDAGWRPINNAFDLRVHLLGEEYRPARELLEASGADETGERTDLEKVRAGNRRPSDGVGQFAWDALTVEPDGQTILDHIQYGYLAYAEMNDHNMNLSRQAISQKLSATHTPPDDGNSFGDETEYRRPTLHDYPDGRKQTPVYDGVSLKDSSEWMSCCSDPEFAIQWGGEDGTEPVGWDCENCHGEGDGEGGPSEDADPGGSDAPEVVQTADSDELTAEMDTTEETGNTATAPEDATDPATEDMDCCDHPEPTPMYAGEERDTQVGWKCSACGSKEFN